MRGFGMTKGKWTKAGLAALGLSVVAVPAATAVAMQSDGGHGDLTAAQVEEGRQLFNDWSCGACHALADANAYGQIGPRLDGNDNLDVDYTVARITNGQGAMPAFGGQMSEEEIELLSTYIVEVKQ